MRRAETLLSSFRFATAGLRHLFVSQRNARVQVTIAVGAVVLGALLGLSRIEWVVLTLVIVLVISLEAVNSAIEATVDLVTEDFHPLAKAAKDLAAGAVWLMALGAVVIGLLLFAPRLWALLPGDR